MKRCKAKSRNEDSQKRFFDRPPFGEAVYLFIWIFYIYSNADRQSLDRMPEYVVMAIVKMLCCPNSQMCEIDIYAYLCTTKNIDYDRNIRKGVFANHVYN